MTDLNLADWMERRRGSLDAHADHIIASVREYEAALSTRAPDPRVQALVDALRPFASAADARRRKDLMGGRIFLQPDLIAARAALKQWEDGE